MTPLLRTIVLALVLWAGVVEWTCVALPVVPPMPENLDLVRVYLLTVGRGEAIHSKYGHSFIRVKDSEPGLDLTYNWGIFDYDDPNFVLNFYRGDLRYMLGVASYASVHKHYRQQEHRKVVQQEIRLTRKQKERLITAINDNARPENRYYSYDIFRNNCATKIRDYLDDVLGGALARRFQERRSNLRFRRHIRFGVNDTWWAYLGLDMLSNSLLDRDVSQWEEMFVPELMRHHLSEVPALDDHGRPTGQNLLSPPEILIDLPEPDGGLNPYYICALILGAMLLPLTWVTLRRMNRGVRPAVPLRPAGVVLVAWGLWSGCLGTVMTANWLVSNHLELRHNLSLLMFWPVDLVYVGIGIRLLVRGRPLEPRSILGGALRMISLAHVAGVLTLLFVWTAGITSQNVLAVLAVFGTSSVFIYGGCVGYLCSSSSVDSGSEHGEGEAVVASPQDLTEHGDGRSASGGLNLGS